jgi:hypothetical protein
VAETPDKREYTPKGGRLPGKTLADAQTIAKALADLAGPASKEMVASQNRESVGGNFRAKFASANYYGLIKKESDQYHLTDRGESVLAGDPQAKCAAVMGTGFGPVIQKFSTRNVNKDAIKARLKSDCQAADSALENLSDVLIASSEDAGLIVNGKFDAAAIESVPKDDVGPKAQAPKRERKRSGGSSGGSEVRRKTSPPPPPQEEPEPPKVTQAPPVQIVVQIDASKMDGPQVAELIRALQETK